MGCDFDTCYIVLKLVVSIHAPAWGATQIAIFDLANLKVSIHAPAWGATWQLVIDLIGHHGFNPRTRMGCDLKNDSEFFIYNVSIHAPAWGATYQHFFYQK